MSIEERIEVLFFGCKGQPGHFLYGKSGMIWGPDRTIQPWGSKLDSGLLTDSYHTADTRPDGKTRLHHLDGWTALSFWDRSGDVRPGSNSTFLCHAIVDEATLLSLARQQWPEIFNRQKFPLSKT